MQKQTYMLLEPSWKFLLNPNFDIVGHPISLQQ